MKMTLLLAATVLVGGLVFAIPGYAADSAAGEKIFKSTCFSCHKNPKLNAFAGKSEADLQTAIKSVVTGSVKHPKKLTLGDDDIANVASYIATMPK
jgi:mono/diheme cytochrome c family protein